MISKVSVAILAILCCGQAMADQPIITSSNYWQCSTEDKANSQWTAQNSYRKIAINKAFEACKKESQLPATCKTSHTSCEHYVDGINTSPQWQCTALDYNAEPWKSNLYQQRDSAALAALAYCKSNSSIPATCYMNMVTCRDKNEWAAL
jgi:hypothetical protein